MTDEELVFAIAVFIGYDLSFRDVRDDGDEHPWYIDAECDKIPDYVRILGKQRAEQFLEMFRSVANFPNI